MIEIDIIGNILYKEKILVNKSIKQAILDTDFNLNDNNPWVDYTTELQGVRRMTAMVQFIW